MDTVVYWIMITTPILRTYPLDNDTYNGINKLTQDMDKSSKQHYNIIPCEYEHMNTCNKTSYNSKWNLPSIEIKNIYFNRTIKSLFCFFNLRA